MIYPANFEQKIGFNQVREMLKSRCKSTLGKDEVDRTVFLSDAVKLNILLKQTREMRRLREEADGFPNAFFYDLRPALNRIKIENTHLEEPELFDLRRSLETIIGMVRYLNRNEQGEMVATTNESVEEPTASNVKFLYPTLQKLTENVVLFPQLLHLIDRILDPYGRIKDNASPALLQIRSELKRVESSISRTLNSILKAAQTEGLVDKDASPALRDGRLVIPIAPGLKRKIKGIVHDESATGKTVFVEPAEVVEANNRIRELENDEKKEIIRILSAITQTIRPHILPLLQGYWFMGMIDFIEAKADIATQMCAIEPEIQPNPLIDWVQAIHPLLRISLEKQGKKVVPLDIMLAKDKRMLIISGPNAGGKSVCLKAVGLLQYMLQCGLSIPVSERSKAGVFNNIMIDIGDEQSIENDLSTYSSHLLNMKHMMKTANSQSLLLIDEFGTGTEPQIGGAIAEAVLQQFCNKQAWGVITTHYQNLKHFADSHTGVVNGAMLYDRHQMQALFQLAIGQPGSSFAVEIARKTGIPEEVIQHATNIVGSEYIQSDKYLQDIVRDKRYWENKRQAVHQREKELDKTIERYETDIKNLEADRKIIIKKAKENATTLLEDANKRIENTIREIRHQQAEKEATRLLRQELKAYEDAIKGEEKANNQEKGLMSDDDFAKKLAQIQRRKERKEQRKNEKQSQKAKQQEAEKVAMAQKKTSKNIEEGDEVRIIGLTSVGTVERIDGQNATVIFGDMRTKMRLNRLELAPNTPNNEKKNWQEQLGVAQVTSQTRQTIDQHRQNFKPDLDVRGMRGDEALSAVQYFIDDAILMGANNIRILHGKGNGILRQLIRQYLGSVPNISSYRDEHVQFGGAGITVVTID